MLLYSGSAFSPNRGEGELMNVTTFHGAWEEEMEEDDDDIHV